MNWISLKFALLIMCYIEALLQFMKFTSVAGTPHDWVNKRNCSMTTDILLSHFNSGLFPASKAPYICKAGI